MSAGGPDGLRNFFKLCGVQWTVFVSHFLFSSSTVVEHMLNQSKIFGGRHNKTRKYTCVMLDNNICAHGSKETLLPTLFMYIFLF